DHRAGAVMRSADGRADKGQPREKQGIPFAPHAAVRLQEKTGRFLHDVITQQRRNTPPWLACSSAACVGPFGAKTGAVMPPILVNQYCNLWALPGTSPAVYAA